MGKLEGFAVTTVLIMVWVCLIIPTGIVIIVELIKWLA